MGLTASAKFTPRGDLGRFVPARVTPAIRASVQAALDLIADRERQLVPVDTGQLRDSIATSIDDTGKTIVGRVGPNTPYMFYVEFGTGIVGASSAGAGPGPYSTTWPGMKAQPFVRPAFDEAKPAILDLFRSNVLLSL